MKVILSSHAKKRLEDKRQRGLKSRDIVIAAKNVPGKISFPMRWNGFVSENKVKFSLVMLDISNRRHIITIIGGDEYESERWVLPGK